MNACLDGEDNPKRRYCHKGRALRRRTPNHFAVRRRVMYSRISGILALASKSAP